MLEQLQKDWKAAITSADRKLIRQDIIEVNGERVVKSQKVLFKFRNTEAFMDLELFRGDEHLSREKRRYRNTVQVPSTNKQVIIYPREWDSPVEKMMTILIAFTKGRDHEDRMAIRRQLAVIRENDIVVEQFRTSLNKTSFDEDEKSFIINWLDNNIKSKKVSWNKVLLEIIVKYHNYVTGRGLIELGINLGHDSSKHVNRCYDTAARIINASNHPNGKRYLPREVANPLFLEIKDVLMPIYVVRSMYAKIWDRCFEEGNSDNSVLFVWICDFLGAYYSKVTGVPLEKHCQDIQQRFIEAANRRAARRISGKNGTGRNFREPVQGPIMTVGDEYGNVLDQAVKSLKHERVDKNRECEEEELKPQKRKFRPAVVTVETEESEYKETQTEKFEKSEDSDLGSVGDAFDRADLL